MQREGLETVDDGSSPAAVTPEQDVVGQHGSSTPPQDLTALITSRNTETDSEPFHMPPSNFQMRWSIGGDAQDQQGGLKAEESQFIQVPMSHNFAETVTSRGQPASASEELASHSLAGKCLDTSDCPTAS